MLLSKFYLKFLLFLILILSFESRAQTVKTYSTAGTYYWTCPFDVTSIQVECWGGGGGGGAAQGLPSAGGGGGGGGYVKNVSLTVVPNTTYMIVVGAGGVTAATTDGGVGGSSYFNNTSTVLAVGGLGGLKATANSSTAAGAAAQTSGNVGFSSSFSYYGGAGGTGAALGVSSGGGGSSAGTGSNGNNASGITGGAAVTGGVAGSNGTTLSAIGTAGVAGGAGGSGGRAGNATDRKGGAGGAGKIILTYTTTGIFWNGAGVSGGTGGTDFNTAANWSPANVPGANDVAVITTSTAAAISLSANVSIGELYMTNSATTNIALSLDIASYVLTINGDLVMNINEASTNTNESNYLKIGNSPGALIVDGNTYLGSNANTQSRVGIIGNVALATGKCTFYGNVTFGTSYNPANASGCISSFIWDGNSTQYVYVTKSSTANLFGSCQIGDVNTPTVIFPSSNVSNLQVRSTASPGNLSIKAGSTLDLTSRLLNRQAAGGNLSVEAGATLRLEGTTGGQTGSNFPLNYTTTSPALNATSKVEYYSTSAQTIYDVASPGYGNLTLTSTSIKSAITALDIQGTLTNNTGSTFNGGTSLTHIVKGNWINDGSFTYTTANTISFAGSVNQTIGGALVTSFYNLINSNSSTGLTLDSDIIVTNLLSMLGATAHIDLNGKNINLSSTGSITGESNTDRIFGSGEISVTRNLSNITSLNVAGLGCVLTTAANMGSTTIVRGHTAQSGSGLPNNTITRYYSISPTNNTGLNATMVFNYFDNELNGLGVEEPNFGLYRSTDGGSTWTERFGTVSVPGNTVTLASISAFSIWTVSHPDPIVLPIELITFDGKKENDDNLIMWTTLTESNNDFFTLERSEDGKNFETIATIDGAGSSSDIIDYRYVDSNFKDIINYYRLVQTDFNGEIRHSELVSIDNRKVVKTVSKIMNIHGQEVDEHFSGVVIIVYSDGSVLRTVQKPLNY